MSSMFIVPCVLIMPRVLIASPLVAVWARRILFNLLSVFIVPSVSRIGLRLLMIMVIVVHK